jgi:hypothetical protein
MLADWLQRSLNLEIARERQGARTVVFNHVFDVAHNLGISPVCFFSHFGDAGSVAYYACWLGVEDKRNGEEAFDPFCKRG